MKQYLVSTIDTDIWILAIVVASKLTPMSVLLWGEIYRQEVNCHVIGQQVSKPGVWGIKFHFQSYSDPLIGHTVDTFF